MHADVDPAMLSTLDALFDLEGNQLLVVRKGLEAFVDRCEGDTDLISWIHDDIQRMLVLDKGKRTTLYTPLSVKVPMPTYIRFVALFPEWGATTWFIRRILAGMLTELQTSGFNLDGLFDRAVGFAVSR